VKVKSGVQHTQIISCPACYGNSCSISGYDSDGRKLVIHFLCTCGAQFVYQYDRMGGDTLFSIHLVQVKFDPDA
jgi:hypothetical protein